MKKRNGFVSNSSSSSFILKTDGDFTDTRQVAEYMLDYIGWLEDDEKEKLIGVLDKVELNEDIFFHTTNYDTYIQRYFDLILVETCNNHDYGDLMYDNSIHHIPEKYKDILEYDEDIEIINDEDYEVEFYSLPHDVHIIRERWDKTPYKDKICETDDHYVDKINIKGKWICPICDLNKYKRILKIKKLLDL